MIKRDVAQRLSRATFAAAQTLEEMAKKADEVFLYMKANNVMENLPQKDPATGREVVQDDSGNWIYRDDDTVFNGTPETMTEKVMAGSYQNLTVGELLQIGNFLATFTYRFLGNSHVDDSSKTVLGETPMTDEQVQEYRRKFTL